MEASNSTWQISRIAPSDFVLLAECETVSAVDVPAETAATFDYHSPRGTMPLRISIGVIRSEGSKKWRVRITWVHYVQLEHLDEEGTCRGCGRPILDVRVNSEGRILVRHAE